MGQRVGYHQLRQRHQQGQRPDGHGHAGALDHAPCGSVFIMSIMATDQGGATIQAIPGLQSDRQNLEAISPGALSAS